MAAAVDEAGHGGADYQKWEFDAPQFHDFSLGSPEGENPDDWFHTSATRGLATPPDLNENWQTSFQDPSNEVAQPPSQDTAEDAENKKPSLQKKISNKKSSEAEQVRAVLAHITNTAAPKQHQSARKATLRSAQTRETYPKTQETQNHEAEAEQTAPVVASEGQLLREKNHVVTGKLERKPAAPKSAPLLPRAAPQETSKDVPSKPTTRSARKVQPRQGPVMPRDRQPPKKALATSMPKLTVPRSPMLRSKQRSAVHKQHMKTSEELELEEIERARSEAAARRRCNAQRLAGSRPAPNPACQPIVNRPALTKPKEPDLQTSKRQRSHGMATRSATAPSLWNSVAGSQGRAEPNKAKMMRPASKSSTNHDRRRPKLTLPKTPKFKTASRARPVRFKSTEEEEANFAASRRNFKARPINKGVMNGGVRPKPKNMPKKPLTKSVPFSFATDARAEKRAKEQAPSRSARPQFMFGGGMGPVTRNRARMVTTAAPVAELVEDIDNTGPSCASMQEPAAAVGSGASGSGTSSEKPNRSASFLLGKRRRTTGGPLLLGGAVRVRQSQQQQSEEKDEQGEVDEADGMQAIIKAGASSTGPTTLHNPLFRV